MTAFMIATFFVLFWASICRGPAFVSGFSTRFERSKLSVNHQANSYLKIESKGR